MVLLLCSDRPVLYLNVQILERHKRSIDAYDSKSTLVLLHTWISRYVIYYAEYHSRRWGRTRLEFNICDNPTCFLYLFYSLVYSSCCIIDGL